MLIASFLSKALFLNGSLLDFERASLHFLGEIDRLADGFRHCEQLFGLRAFDLMILQQRLERGSISQRIDQIGVGFRQAIPHFEFADALLDLTVQFIDLILLVIDPTVELIDLILFVIDPMVELIDVFLSVAEPAVPFIDLTVQFIDLILFISELTFEIVDLTLNADELLFVIVDLFEGSIALLFETIDLTLFGAVIAEEFFSALSISSPFVSSVLMAVALVSAAPTACAIKTLIRLSDCLSSPFSFCSSDIAAFNAFSSSSSVFRL